MEKKRRKRNERKKRQGRNKQEREGQLEVQTSLATKQRSMRTALVFFQYYHANSYTLFLQLF